MIEFINITKEFRVGERFNTYKTLRENLKFFKKKEKSGKAINKALDNVSFKIDEGDSVGIIGRNGSGKSTLLKIISQITYPTSGEVILNGRVGSLLEVGTGFHGELTGRENVFFNGALLGLKKHEIQSKFDEILDFAGVGNYIDTPLKHYSSGMQLRLAFSVAAHLEPEILAIDEVLAVGDASFQKKSMGKINDVSKSGRTVLFVSHNMAIIASLCNKVLILNKGKLIDFGDTNSMIEKYLAMLEDFDTTVFKEEPDIKLPAQVIEAKALNEDGKIQTEFVFSDSIQVEFRLIINQKIDNNMLAFIFYDQLKERVFTLLYKIEDLEIGVHKLLLKLPSKIIAPGLYSAGIEVFAHLHGVYQKRDYILSFNIIDNGTIFSLNQYGNFGKVVIEGQWDCELL